MPLCLQKLIETFHPNEGWRRPNGDSSLGFAHGAAGISYAAAVAGDIFRDDRVATCCAKGIDFDRRHFNESRTQLAFDRERQQSRDASMVQRTDRHVGIDEIGIWRLWRRYAILAEIEANLPFLPNLLGLDHWCCGSAGVAETLIYAAKVS